MSMQWWRRMFGESRENSNKEHRNHSEEAEEGEQASSSASPDEAKKARAAAATEAASDDKTQSAPEDRTQQAILAWLQAIRPEDLKDVAETAASLLPTQEQKELGARLIPDKPVINWIWRVIIGAFALAFVLAVLTLCVAVLWQPGGDIQSLLTVVTTVAGILSGFISGRASAGATAS
jgi:hypothetical protein